MLNKVERAAVWAVLAGLDDIANRKLLTSNCDIHDLDRARRRIAGLLGHTLDPETNRYSGKD